MLLKQATLRSIADGRVTLAFRRWKRPTVKSGGTLLTSIGQLGIGSVDLVDIDDIDETSALAAGFEDLATLRAELLKRADGSIYRISLRLNGPDPRIMLREEVPGSADDFAAIGSRLDRWDASSPSGPWTRAVLRLLDRRPGVRAGDLAPEVDMEKARFKANVRKLKGLGLTESLGVGYRLFRRGAAALGYLGESTR